MTMPLQHPGISISETLQPLSNNGVIPGGPVAAFAAVYNIGPTVPTLISSFSQYLQLYGSWQVAGGNYLHYAVNQFFANGGSQCYVLRMANSDAVTATLQLQDINTPPDNVITVKAYSPGAWGNNLFVSITSAGNPGRFNFNVYSGGTSQQNLVESFIDLSINPADPRNVASIVNSSISGSSNVQVSITLPGVYQAGVNDPALIAATPVAGGSDGVTAPSVTTLVPQYLDTLQGQILNLNLPGVFNSATINSILSWAVGRGDVMMVVDGPAPNFPETSAQVAANYVNLVTGGSALSASSYLTLYAPWILVQDPASSLPGATKWLPPGGAVLGVWSDTDKDAGPYQSPAGITYGGLNTVIDFEARFTDADLNTLNNNNINALRFVNGYGPTVMGARTLQQSYPDRYIAVRRELIQLEHDFTTLLQFALFEPNDARLWAQVTQIITNYLTAKLQQGVFAGSTPANSFQVVCDSSNNTPATSSAGIVNCSVAVSLLSPAEFIFINIQQFQNTGTTTTTTSTS